MALGPLSAHLVEVNRLAPEVAQLDVLTFEATIGTSTLTQPSDVAIPENYDFEMFGLLGYIEEPGLAVANLPLVTWNAKETGKRNVFSTDFSMAGLISIFGPTPPLFFPRSLYRFSAGGTVRVTFARASGWNGGNKKVGVKLIGGLVALPHQKR